MIEIQGHECLYYDGRYWIHSPSEHPTTKNDNFVINDPISRWENNYPIDYQCQGLKLTPNLTSICTLIYMIQQMINSDRFYLPVFNKDPHHFTNVHIKDIKEMPIQITFQF